MQNDIVIFRDGGSFRILFGHLRLTSVLTQAGEVDVGIMGEGMAKIIKTDKGLFVHFQEQHFPLYHR